MASSKSTQKTVKKRPAKPFTGAEGKKHQFTKDNQPSPEAKKKGWEELRKERHLTQSIIKELIGDDGKPNVKFKKYVQSLIDNAEAGNPKAIDAVNKCIEEEIIKIKPEEIPGEKSFNITLTL